jgi:hypothetical protein
MPTVRVIVSTPDRGDVEVTKSLPDQIRYGGLTRTSTVRTLIQSATEQALLAYPAEDDQ